MAKKKPIKKVSKSVKKTEKTKHISQKISKNYNFNPIKVILPILLILIVMALAFYVRSGPITLSSMDEKVEANIYSNIQSIIAQQVNSEYPNLNDFDKQNEIKKRYEAVLNSGEYQGIKIEEFVETRVDDAKMAFQADNGQTYLNAIDPYHFMNYADIYTKNGYKGTTIKDGEPLVEYKLAPVGLKGSNDVEFHIWLENKLYELNGVTFDSSDGDKTAAIYLIPVIFVILSVIPIFIILSKYTDNISAFFGSLLLVTIGTYVSRTIAGFVDTDAYNVFFPLLIAMFVILAILEKNDILKFVYAGLAGLSQGLFLWAWNNGWFMFLFTSIALIVYVGYLIVVELLNNKKFSFEKDGLKNIGLIGTFLVSSFVFTYSIIKEDIFNLVYVNVLGTIENIGAISGSNIWPNVLSSVAELNPASFEQIISSVGGTGALGKFAFLLALIGLVFLTLDFKNKYEWSKVANRTLLLVSIIWFLVFMNASYLIELTANYKLLFIILLFVPIGVGMILSLINGNNSNKLFLAILVSIWIAGTIYMSLNGVRFILLLAPAFAIAFGVGLFYISKIINNFVKTEFKPVSLIGKNAFGFVLITILFGIIFMPAVSQAVLISENTLPNFDDAWYSSMHKIKNESSQDAIITSWWDFGHFFAAIADRGVTFDGGSQTTPRAHWVGKLLMENDEAVSYDILKMLVCGGNEAFNTMYSYVGNDSSDAVKINKILYSTFGVEDKKTILSENKYYDLTEEQIDEVMNYLSCETPSENFLVTSEDMVGKAGVWAHWGSWDFTKKYVHDNYKVLSSNEIALNIDENVSLIDVYVSELKEIDRVALEQSIKREDLINRWFADYPSYIPIQGRYEFPCMNNKNISLVCQNGVEIDGKSGEILKHSFGEEFTFRNLYLPGINNSVNVVEQNATGQFDAVLIPSQSGLNIMLTQAPLGGSLFTKLFYLDGAGTEQFEKFDDVQSATGVRVKIWKTNWSKE